MPMDLVLGEVFIRELSLDHIHVTVEDCQVAVE